MEYMLEATRDTHEMTHGRGQKWVRIGSVIRSILVFAYLYIRGGKKEGEKGRQGCDAYACDIRLNF